MRFPFLKDAPAVRPSSPHEAWRTLARPRSPLLSSGPTRKCDRAPFLKDPCRPSQGPCRSSLRATAPAMDVVQGNALKLDVGAKQALSAVTPWVGGEGEAAQSQVSNAGPLFSLQVFPYHLSHLCCMRFSSPTHLPRRTAALLFQT